MDKHILLKYYKADVKDVRKILNDWDILGVVPEGITDEYDPLIPAILSLLPQNPPASVLSNVIYNFLTCDYGMPGSVKTEVVTKKIFDWWRKTNVSVGGPNFERLLGQFKENLVFKKLLEKTTALPDEILYKIETNVGIYYVLEIDFIDDFKYVADLINGKIGGFKYFVEVKEPPISFEETSPYKNSSNYKKPKDFDYFKKYMNDKYGTFNSYFNFLIKV